MILFTLIAINPVNDALLQAGGVSSAEIDALLIRWGNLHWVRTMASGMAFAICLVAIVDQRLSTADFRSWLVSI